MFAGGRDVAIRHRAEHELHAERGLRPYWRVEGEPSYFAARLTIDDHVPEQVTAPFGCVERDVAGGKRRTRGALGQPLRIPCVEWARRRPREVHRIAVAHDEHGNTHRLVG